MFLFFVLHWDQFLLHPCVRVCVYLPIVSIIAIQQLQSAGVHCKSKFLGANRTGCVFLTEWLQEYDAFPAFTAYVCKQHDKPSVMSSELP